MKSKLLGMLHLSGCQHEFSWPRRWPDGDFYQVCLVCGEEYKYDWKSMRRLERITETRPATQLLRREGSVVRVGKRSRARKLSWVPRARRVKVSGSGILYRRTGTAAWLRGSIDNISSSGVLFRCKETLPENTDVEMFLEMPSEISGQKNSRVLARGMIVRCETAPKGKHSMAAGIWDYNFVHDEQQAEKATGQETAK